MSRNSKAWGGLILAVVVLAAAVLLFRPRAMPPPGTGTAAATLPSRPSPSWPRTFRDALGSEVTLAGPAQRLVTMSPNLAEIVCAVGAGGQLVGVDAFTKYPPEAATKEKIGGITNPDLERILALSPDLVLVSRGLDRALIDRLKALGLRVLAFDPQSLDQVLDLIGEIGRICGKEAQAEQLTASLAARRDRVRAAAPSGPQPVRVLLTIAWDGLFVAGLSSFANDLIETAGGVNAVARMPGIPPEKPWPNVTRELVVLSDPQLIILAGEEAAPGSGGAAGALAWLRGDKAWAGLSAVRTGQVVVLDADLLTIPGPRLFDGLEQLAAAVREAAGKAG